MKKITGYDLVYYVDESGNIYDCNKQPLELASFENKYRYCKLVLEGKEVNRLCHILVAKAFIKNPDPLTKLLVNHKDLNRQNNHISNLEWVTHSENQHHHLRLRPNRMKEKKIKELQSLIDNPSMSEVIKEKARKAIEKLNSEPEQVSELAKEEKPKRAYNKKSKSDPEETEASYDQLLERGKKKREEKKGFKKKEEPKDNELIAKAKAKAATRKNKKK